jgi:hypothetical protein
MSAVADVGFFFTVVPVAVEDVLSTPAEDVVLDVVDVCADAVMLARAVAARASAPEIKN